MSYNIQYQYLNNLHFYEDIINDSLNNLVKTAGRLHSFTLYFRNQFVYHFIDYTQLIFLSKNINVDSIYDHNLTFTMNRYQLPFSDTNKFPNNIYSVHQIVSSQSVNSTWLNSKLQGDDSFSNHFVELMQK
ncbi:Hypothetical_protein [Hexamita inflata]|uniref:Hypothetical_protein n=1 Tax=Hexamita inflata TaxID=28002 RepID=A0AA86PFG0_9EUKA|nr:Hypothetical protein HINF_LOCUS25849 [Hexamita inflata]